MKIKDRPVISVIIPTFNEERYIEKCIKPLLNQTLPRNEYEIIIVDGGSKDKTVKISKKLGAKVIKQKSKGVGGARNDGVYVAKSNIIATTDADAIVPNNWLEKILVNFNDPNVVFVSGTVCFIGKRWYKLFGNIGDSFCVILSAMGIVPSVGANISFKKENFLKIGGFKYSPIMDDFEMPFRIKKTGKYIYRPDIKVHVSDRRLRKHGFLKTHFHVVYNGLRIVFKKDVQNIKYHRQNY